MFLVVRFNMKIVGFNFTKIYVEKFPEKGDEVKASTNINIIDIIPFKSDVFKSKDEILEVTFSYNLSYTPNFAKIEFKGRVLVSIDPKLSKEILKTWDKKETPEEFKLVVFNTILRKANLKALDIEEELGLPLHIPLPTIQPKKKE